MPHFVVPSKPFAGIIRRSREGRNRMHSRRVLVFFLFVSFVAVTPGFAADRAEPRENTAVSPQIHVDQAGYGTADKKEVMIDGKGGAFAVIDAASGKSFFSGIAGDPVEDDSSGETVYRGDFSGVRAPGAYMISMPGVGVSYRFRIGDDVYREPKDAALKALYYQRCGIALEEKYAGAWKHGACHLLEGRLFDGRETRDGNGGWHDAGDYGKYTVAGAVAVAGLLLAHEFFPAAFTDGLNIPESGNGVPDVLDEARFELEWLLKMQDGGSGGVYHKLTTMGFPDLLLMPDQDMGTPYFCPVSRAATSDFAAVMAMAARVYASLDAAFSARCLAASEAAWEWLAGNPPAGGFKNPPGIRTGEYGDENLSDEQFWAAAELYRTTGKRRYREYVESVLGEGNTELTGLGWRSVGGFGSVAYLLTDGNRRDEAVAKRIWDGFAAFCGLRLDVREKDGYRVTLMPDEYRWGSNMTLLSDAMRFLIADRFAPNPDYVEAARDNLHYLLGRNVLNQNYLTGLGANPIKKPHHRPSVADGVGDPVPGLVSGGPNMFLEDSYSKSKLKDLPPARCFLDSVMSYSTNEVAIYWNTPAVFVLAGLSGR